MPRYEVTCSLEQTIYVNAKDEDAAITEASRIGDSEWSLNEINYDAIRVDKDGIPIDT